MYPLPKYRSNIQGFTVLGEFRFLITTYKVLTFPYKQHMVHTYLKKFSELTLILFEDFITTLEKET
jgi:hypothetical protein